jgi:hypothetical protein
VTRLAAGDLPGARADYTQAAASSPSYAWAVMMSSVIAAAHGDLEAGRLGVERAAMLDASAVEPAIWRAVLGGDLDHLAPHAGSQVWSARVVHFWQGKLTADELIGEAARAPTARRARERACEAHTFAGLQAERRGDREGARRHYAKTVEMDIPWSIEHAWARQRLASADLR